MMGRQKSAEGILRKPKELFGKGPNMQVGQGSLNFDD